MFIDEIQYLENPSSFLKLLHDHSPIKLIVSGSSSFAIKSKFKNSLVGRTLNFELFGLNFQEFLDFKDENINLDKLDKKTPKIIHEKLKGYFLEYALYGSYPKIILEKNIEIKEQLIKQIINTYVKKDIADLAKINNIQKFNNLLKVLAMQSGNLINIGELSNMLQLSRETVEKYIFILENTYIIKLIYPYSKNPKVELSKMPKLYFEDTGLLNILRFYNFPQVLDGILFENTIYSILRKIINAERIHFWRTKQHSEVDFVVEDKQNLFAIEAKQSFFKNSHSGLKSFTEKYNPKEYFISSIEGNNITYPWMFYNLFNK